MCTCQFTVPEIKIIFVLLYWLLDFVLALTAIAVLASRTEMLDYVIRNYTDCMAGGNRRHHNCHRSRLDLEAQSSPASEIINIFLTAFLNWVSLPFVIQFQTVKRTLRQAVHKHCNYQVSYNTTVL